MSEYHFGISGNLLWISHILLGLFFIYLGYITLNGKNLTQIQSLTLIVLGSLAVLYHLHLWYVESKEEDENIN